MKLETSRNEFFFGWFKTYDSICVVNEPWHLPAILISGYQDFDRAGSFELSEGVFQWHNGDFLGGFHRGIPRFFTGFLSQFSEHQTSITSFGILIMVTAMHASVCLVYIYI